jgi:hypothetical protein
VLPPPRLPLLPPPPLLPHPPSPPPATAAATQNNAIIVDGVNPLCAYQRPIIASLHHSIIPSFHQTIRPPRAMHFAACLEKMDAMNLLEAERLD